MPASSSSIVTRRRAVDGTPTAHEVKRRPVEIHLQQQRLNSVHRQTDESVASNLSLSGLSCR
jgi:hypothetical protein